MKKTIFAAALVMPVLAHAAGKIINADIAPNAGIYVNKLAAVTPSVAVVADGSGFVTGSITTTTEIGFVHNVTSSIQTQLNAKGGSISSYSSPANQFVTGFTSPNTFVSAQPSCSNLSNAAASCATDATNATNISTGTLSNSRLGVVDISHGGTNSASPLSNNRIIVSQNGALVEDVAVTGSRAIVSDTNGLPVGSPTTSTEIGYVNGVTSSIQAQINNIAGRGLNALTALTGDGTASGPGSSALTLATVNASNNGTFNNASVTVNSKGLVTSASNPYYSTRTANYTLTSIDAITAVSASASFTITLPTAVGNAGQQYVLKRIDNNLATTVSIATTSNQTIDGYASGVPGLNTLNEEYRLASDGLNWKILDHKATTPWTPYSVTITNGTKGTTTIDQGYWRRVGDSAQIRYEYKQTSSGSSGSGTYTFSLPSVLFIDTTKISSFVQSNNLAQSLGAAECTDANTQTWGGTVQAADTTHVYLNIANPSAASNAVGSTTCNLGSTNMRYGFEATIPINGWFE